MTGSLLRMGSYMWIVLHPPKSPRCLAVSSIMLALMGGGVAVIHMAVSIFSSATSRDEKSMESRAYIEIILSGRGSSIHAAVYEA